MKQKNSSKNKVYIVGAGPGDIDLITLKGLKILKKADCVIYDRLVNKELLTFVPKTAELINADDTRNNFLDGFTKEQDKLNGLIIKKAKKYRVVVRLKNGDPVMFGRLNEEVLALTKNKIDFEIVPGITSASVAAASSKIGLTKTKMAPIVLFLTGHEDPFDKNSSIDYKKLPHRATLVFYMASENISKLSDELMAIGWNRNTFCEVINNVSLPTENKWICKLKDVKKITNTIKPPVVFLVGDILKYAIKKE